MGIAGRIALAGAELVIIVVLGDVVIAVWFKRFAGGGGHAQPGQSDTSRSPGHPLPPVQKHRFRCAIAVFQGVGPAVRHDMLLCTSTSEVVPAPVSAN